MDKPITISLHASGDIQLHIPGPGAGHYARVPMNIAGLAIIRHILQERNERPGGIGTDASPIQAMIDIWLKDHPKPQVLSLKDLDL